MPTSPPLVARCVDVLHGYFELGNETASLAAATLVGNAAVPRVYDANCVTRVRADSTAAVDALVTEVDAILQGLSHRTYKLDPLTPTGVEARLVLDGYRADTELQMVLDGELLVAAGQAPRSPVSIRPVTDDRDWAALGHLFRLDHLEEADRAGTPAITSEVTEQIVAAKQAKAQAVHFFLAEADGEDVAFFSSWPGREGLGKVEDLFTRPDRRNQGIATALLAHCVADARARGADDVLIGADADDTPRHLYAKLGFQPTLMVKSYTQDIISS